MNAARKERVEGQLGLVQRASRGDVRAFEQLYRDNVGTVYGLCLRLTRHRANAEDCTQEAFINAWRSLGKFESRSSFSTWVHRIAVNVVLSRRRGGRGIEPGAPAAAPGVGELSGQPVVFDTPVEALPEGARDVLVLSTDAAARVNQGPGSATPLIAEDEGERREALLRSLNARLRTLPPPTQQKVRADLQIIERSIQDIQSALGRDPGNALLHELLHETEQDELHLAATVRDAGAWTEEASGGQGRVGS
jgi:RNA polymerase sigma-70 factor (ECF subfamily)